MGPQGTRTGFPGDLVLDAGALIAFERGDDRVRAILNGALALSSRIIIPATVLAQAWRGGPGSALLARLLAAGEVDSFDERRAKDCGVRLGIREASDIADAHVVCCATELRSSVVTSDSDDILRLAHPGERLTLISV
jgi:hypothetical protein